MTVRRKKLVAVASMAAMVLQTAACDRHTVHPDDARPVPDLSAVADRKVTPDAWADQDAWPDQRVDDLGAADLGPDASPDLPADMSKDKSPYDLLGCYVPPDQKLVLDKVGASKDLKQADAAAKAKGFLLTADTLVEILSRLTRRAISISQAMRTSRSISVESGLDCRPSGPRLWSSSTARARLSGLSKVLSNKGRTRSSMIWPWTAKGTPTSSDFSVGN